MDALRLALADLIVVVHLAYLAFIPLGGFLAWRWPRIVPWHLAAIAIGLVSITVGFDCPLTTWEQTLRDDAGQRVARGAFVDHYLAGKVFPHGDAWVVQVAFATAIVVSYAVLIRKWVRSRGSAPAPG